MTWENIKEDISISQLLGVDISNTFYNEVLEYYFGDVPKFNEIFIKLNDGDYDYYQDGIEIATIKYINHNICFILRTSFENYLNAFATAMKHNLYDIMTNYFLYKHNIIIEVK